MFVCACVCQTAVQSGCRSCCCCCCSLVLLAYFGLCVCACVHLCVNKYSTDVFFSFFPFLFDRFELNCLMLEKMIEPPLADDCVQYNIVAFTFGKQKSSSSACTANSRALCDVLHILRPCTHMS